MINKSKLSVLLGLVLLLCYACKKENDQYQTVDGQDPVLVMDTEHIRSENGREFKILANVKDNDGIARVILECSEILLNKTIDVSRDSLVKDYRLDYKFTMIPSLVGDDFVVKVTVEDVLGKKVIKNVRLTMDGDFTAPLFRVVPDENVTVLIKSETRLNLRFTVEDDKKLGTVSISIPELNLSEEIKTFENEKLFSYASSLVLPSQAATYNCTITVKDAQENTVTKNIKLNVSETPDFAKMYLVDVEDAALLNSDLFGVPMLIERTAPYTYRARYYNKVSGTKIRFAPQKTDFNPISYGLHPEDNTKLTDEPDLSIPLILNNIGYYEVVFNIKTGTYSTRTYTPTDTPVAIGSNMLLDGGRPGEGSIPLRLGLVGTGLPGAGNWSTSSPLFLEQHATNKYLFSAEFNLEAGKKIGFIISAHHSWGWWPEPFWRWDRKDDPEGNVSNAGENLTEIDIRVTGKYRFEFDTHLKRSKLYRIN